MKLDHNTFSHFIEQNAWKMKGDWLLGNSHIDNQLCGHFKNEKFELRYDTGFDKDDPEFDTYNFLVVNERKYSLKDFATQESLETKILELIK